MDDETARLEYLKLASGGNSTDGIRYSDALECLMQQEVFRNWIFAKIVVEPTKA